MEPLFEEPLVESAPFIESAPLIEDTLVELAPLIQEVIELPEVGKKRKRDED